MSERETNDFRRLEAELGRQSRMTRWALALGAVALCIAVVTFLTTRGDLVVSTTDDYGVLRITRVQAGTISMSAETRNGMKETVVCGAGATLQGPCGFQN